MVFQNIQLSTTTRVMMTQCKDLKWTRAEEDAGLPCEAGSGCCPPPRILHRPWDNFPLSLQVEQVSQLAVFIEAALEYHKQSTEILQELQSKLQMR